MTDEKIGILFALRQVGIPIDSNTSVIHVPADRLVWRMPIYDGGYDPSNHEEVELNRFLDLDDRSYRYGYGQRSNTIVYFRTR